MVSGLLSAIPSDVDLWEASDEDLTAVDPLWDALLQMPGVGTATASKLLARKRPRLRPISDKVVIGAVGVPAGPGRHCAPARPRRTRGDKGAAAATSRHCQRAADP